jgi:hypothetical protein
VFTKYDQFRFNVEMDMFDDPDKYPDSNVSRVVEKRFQEYYLHPLGHDVRYVRLESMLGAVCQRHMADATLSEMNMKDSRCDSLVEKTAAALNEDTVALMLLTVQRGNLELSVKTALSR